MPFDYSSYDPFADVGFEDLEGVETEPSYLRRKNIFSPSLDDSVNDMDAMGSTSDAASPSLQKYREMIETAPPSEGIMGEIMASRPKHEDYKQNTFQKILTAIIAGSAGMKDPMLGVRTARELMDDPYNRAMGLWRADNEGKMEQAKLADAAFGRKMRGAQFDVEEERRRGTVDVQRSRALETERKNRAAEDRQRQLDGLNKRYKEAQINGQQERMQLLKLQMQKLEQDISLKGSEAEREAEPTAFDANKQMEAEEKIKNKVGQDILREMKDSGHVLSANIVEETDDDGNVSLTSTDPNVIRYVQQRYKVLKPRFRQVK